MRSPVAPAPVYRMWSPLHSDSPRLTRPDCWRGPCDCAGRRNGAGWRASASRYESEVSSARLREVHDGWVAFIVIVGADLAGVLALQASEYAVAQGSTICPREHGHAGSAARGRRVPALPPTR